MRRDLFDDFTCPHCKRLTSFAQVNDFLIGDVLRGSVSVDRKAAAYVCHNPSCGKRVVVLKEGGSVLRLLWPSPAPRELPGEAPESVREAYREASQCQSIGAMRAAGAMYRMALEMICDELEIPRTGSNADGKPYRMLANRVPELEGKGLTPDLVRDMHEVRLVGNDSIHDGLTFSEDELTDVREMVEEVVETLFVQPAKRDAMRASRQARRAGST